MKTIRQLRARKLAKRPRYKRRGSDYDLERREIQKLRKEVRKAEQLEWEKIIPIFQKLNEAIQKASGDLARAFGKMQKILKNMQHKMKDYRDDHSQESL